MMNYTILSPTDSGTDGDKDAAADFLFEHLDQYGDKREDIMKAIDYALSDDPGRGGFLLIGRDADTIVGVVVVNRTGMSGYIPENILVYIATHGDYRGKGIGKELMKRSLENADGDVALHVEPDNPAKFLYEKVGFTSKYLEMRYHKA